MAAYEDLEIQRWHVRTLNAEEALAWIEARAERWREETGAEWAVTAIDDVGGQLLGRMGLKRIDLEEGTAEVAYWTKPEHRGRGYASAALEVLGVWAFETLGLERLELTQSVHNSRSCGLAERAAYPLEGTKRHAGLHADGWHDMHLHARSVATGYAMRTLWAARE